MKRFTGVFAPIVTPFDAADALDEPAFTSNLARWLETPLTGIVVLGSNGEAVQLDDAEADRVVELARARIPPARPLLAGTGRESTRATIAATRRAAAAGVDAVLVRTPAFFKPQMTAEVFVRHYTEVADASPVPVLLYNVTAFTGVNLPVDAVARLAAHPNIAGMKESGSDIGQIAEYIGATPDDFTVLAGSATTLVHALAAGCDGAVLAIAMLLPEACVEMVRLVASGRLDRARALQRQLLPLARAVGSGAGVPGLKAALHLIGYTGGNPRPPLRPASSSTTASIRGHLVELGLLPAAREVHPVPSF